jgi:hypothetical protein
LPEVERYRTVPIAALGSGWPSDELWLIINPGTADAVDLPAERVRELPSLVVS